VRTCRSSREAGGSTIRGGVAEANGLGRVGTAGDMLIVRPDFARTIDLPGAGLCRRPIDIDRSRTGFSNLVSLRVYSFAAGVGIDGEAEGDEVFIVLMRGAADIAISQDGRTVGAFSLRREGGTRIVYMPPHASYRLTAAADCDIAYARAEPSGTKLPEVRSFAPDADRLDVAGHATGMNLALATVRAGEVVGLCEDGQSPERFVHIRAGDGTTATIGGDRLGDWDTAVLHDDEMDLIEIETGTAEILTVSASRRRNETG
jgi:hypothetical protein